MPRVLSILFTGFLSLFALDVFVEGRPGLEILAALLIHLIPSFLLAILLILAWRRPWIGAAGYAALAAAYGMISWHRPLSVALIAGPLLLIACLYGLAWRVLRRARTADS
ncbi:MAG: hypothetical protein N2036_16260 [Bryobacteraceae bacterium]|nr:hypothetical protein [Bryobacteraceae bacterium]MCX7605629.1 hypothetical protein [Bryobacteraceae bacterium]